MIEVLWTVNGNNTWKKLFLDPDRVAYLDGSFLKAHLGSTIGCKVRSNYRGSQYASPWLSSNTYWVGLQTEPSRLEISEKEELRNVLLTSTIPILCSSPRDGGCCLSLRLDVEGSRQNLVTAGDCEYKLCARENVSDSASVNIPLMAVRDLIDDGDVELLLSFQVIQAEDGDLNPLVFEGYRALTTNITVRDVEIPSCSWTGDSHVHGFESSLSFNLYNVGDYTMYENPSRAFEIQARTWPCNGGNVTCVCGIAIRELNEIIRIDQCDQPYGSPHTSPLVTVYSQPLRDGTVILRSSDGSKIVVNLPSGTGISVDARRWGLNVHLLASPVDEGKGRGVCGTFDGDPLNEFTHRNGYVDSSSLLPINFTESWRNNKTQSLFKSLPPKVIEPDATKYCSCDTGSGDVTRSNCTSRRHVSSAAFNCPNCPDITDRLTVVAGGALNATDLDEQDARFEPDNFTDFQPANPTWPTSSNLTEEQSRVKCQEGLRSSQLWTHCQSIQKIVDSYQQDCVADILFGDTYDLVESATASFSEECQTELSKDPDNYVTSSTGEIVMKAELSADLCGATCLRHGTCNMGALRLQHWLHGRQLSPS
ncbi:von Willebrand factor D and EGF domain-containing protein-like [Pomacea canaliculata]|uniref:von Willebrand factor D and EGF domain-containing protein-like n=1 Tax=Pomacea canaliculata TaxID=400727 RepID=UPI000D73D3C9|nr:von Willebrand factor D and EGF domain-containing protein-like [Pomacea canaliculata]